MPVAMGILCEHCRTVYFISSASKPTHICYDRRRGVYVQAFGRPDLDAALLLLPTVEFVDWRDQRMIRTVDAIREELGAGDGLLHRYRRDDGLPGQEGAFLCCSFWLAECLAHQGERSEARSVFDSTVATA